MAQATTSATVHDVVVIGSGAGGGTATKVLADLGVPVQVIANAMVRADRGRHGVPRITPTSSYPEPTEAIAYALKRSGL